MPVATESTTYLELSEEGAGAHKFYEVRHAGTEVTITYGRIGERGQTRTSDFPTVQKAAAAVARKAGEKMRKGYALAVPGVRKRRPVTRREIVSSRSTASQAPMLWRFRSGSPAFGIFVDDDHAWVGNQAGDVYTLTHDGQVTGRFGLPDGVKCIVADDFWVYAGCDDGRVYKATGWRQVTPTAEVETVITVPAASGDGVLVECVQEGARTRVRVLSPGYDPSWRVQFPKDVRVPGARYVVPEIHVSARGGFYRARGEIKRLL